MPRIKGDRRYGFEFPPDTRLALLDIVDNHGYGVARRGAHVVRFRLLGDAIETSVGCFALAIARADEALAHIAQLRALQALLDRSAVPPRPLSAVAHERLRMALLAVDGQAKGLSYREIAISIFGEKAVATGWSDIDRILKNRTIRAVQRGHRYIAGDYSKLLAQP